MWTAKRDLFYAQACNLLMPTCMEQNLDFKFIIFLKTISLYQQSTQIVIFRF